MSFGFSVGDFLAVIKLANDVRKDFAGAPAQLKVIHHERGLPVVSIVSCTLTHLGLGHVLQDVEDILSTESLTQRQCETLGEIQAGCQELLDALGVLVRKNSVLESRQDTAAGKARRMWKRFKWDPEIVNDLRTRIASQVALLNAFTSGLTNEAVFTIRDRVSYLHTEQEERARKEIIEWFSDVSYALQQYDCLSRREEGTGQWLLDCDNFQRWLSEKSLTLFCPGIPGSGKTILTSVVIDHLQTKFLDSIDTGIAYVYCNFRRKAEQTARDLVRSILAQLLIRSPELPHAVQKTYQECMKMRTQPKFLDLMTCLTATVSLFTRTFIVIDALDESLVSRDGRDLMLSELFRLQEGTSLSIFATSRFIPDIEQQFENSLTTEIRGHDDDLHRYLSSSIATLRPFVRRNADLQKEIRDVIANSVDGMFLLAQLYVQSLQAKTTPKAIRLALQKLPKVSTENNPTHSSASTQAREAYDISYEVTMERIKSQRETWDLARRVLGWISRAKRSLEANELRVALAVEMDEETLDRENMPALEDVLSVCAGLVTVDEQSSIIRLIHYTAQEYLDRTWKLWFPEADVELCQTCLKYLSFSSQIWTFSAWKLRVYLDSTTAEQVEFYQYAAENWGYHCQGSAMDGDPDVFAFFYRERNIIQEAEDDDPRYELGNDFPLTPLRISAYFGLYKTSQKLLDESAEPNSRSSQTVGPIHLASHQGHTDLVELFLERGALLDRPSRGKTPIFIALTEGHVSVVKRLLAAGADANRKAGGRLPLHQAVMDGNVRGVQLLLYTNTVEPRVSDDDLNIALQLACQKKYTKVISLLLRFTPQNQAAKSPNMMVDEWLLRDGKASRSRAFHAVIRENDTNTAKLLLESDHINTTLKDGFGRTALFWALSHGNDEAVSILHSHSGSASQSLVVDIEDNTGLTPLAVAVQTRNTSSMEYLLFTQNADPNHGENSGKGRSPFRICVLEMEQRARRFVFSVEVFFVLRVLLRTGRINLSYEAIQKLEQWTISHCPPSDRHSLEVLDFYNKIADRGGHISYTRMLLCAIKQTCPYLNSTNPRSLVLAHDLDALRISDLPFDEESLISWVKINYGVYGLQPVTDPSRGLIRKANKYRVEQEITHPWVPMGYP